MTTLTEFLLARIADDEEVATEAAKGYPISGEMWATQVDYDDEGPVDRVVLNAARVLAECEAKRRIVELHAARTERDFVNPLDGPAYETEEHYCEICGWVPDRCDTVKVLAQPYADHPDFDPAWAV